MSIVSDARDDLSALLEGVDGVRVYTEVGANIDPPALFVGPPVLLWQAPCSQPTNAQFTVYLMAPNDERAIETLANLVAEVAEVIDVDPNCAVMRADWNSVQVGSTELPSYEILVDVSL